MLRSFRMLRDEDVKASFIGLLESVGKIKDSK